MLATLWECTNSAAAKSQDDPGRITSAHGHLQFAQCVVLSLTSAPLCSRNEAERCCTGASDDESSLWRVEDYSLRASCSFLISVNISSKAGGFSSNIIGAMAR